MSGPASRLVRKSVRVLLWAATAAPPLLILSLILKLGVNVPYQDDWDTASVLITWRQGTISLADLWEQHSEHRIVAVRLLIWLSSILTDFNVVAEMFVGFGCVVLTLLIVHDLLKTALKDDAPHLLWPLTATSSFVLFSLTLQESWFFGTASVELVFYLASTMLIWALTRWTERWCGLIVAICCAVVGLLTEASGFGLWLAGALAIWLEGDARPRRIQRLRVWACAALIAGGAYVWGLHWGGSAIETAASSPTRFVLFVAACLGLPFAYGSSPTWSVAVGLGGCAALGMAAQYIHQERPQFFRRLVPVLLLGGLGLFVSALIGVGRSNLAPRFAMAGHYAIGSSLFWIATIVVTAAATQTAWQTEAAGPRIAARIVAMAPFVLLLGYVVANVQGYRDAYQRSRNLQMALASLYSGDISKGVSRFLYPPDDGRIYRQMVALKALQLGPFAKGMEARKARIGDQFKGSTPTTGTDGFHDGGDCDQTFGWAWDPARPDAPTMVDIWQRGARIGTVTANWFRWDLLEAGVGNGQHAFVFVFPAMLEVGTGQTITVTYAGTATELRGSPQLIMCQ